MKNRNMEQQISTESTDTHLEQVDLENVQSVGLMEDAKESRRRAHIDILIILLVFAKFIEFVLEIYGFTENSWMKHPTNNHSGIFNDFSVGYVSYKGMNYSHTDYQVDEDKYAIIPLDHWNMLAITFGNRFLLPLLYFVSGCNVFYSLCKRSEREFRDERVHRLVVPMLTMLLLKFSNSLAYFAPLDPVCQSMFDQIKSPRKIWGGDCQVTFINQLNRRNATSFSSTLVLNLNLIAGIEFIESLLSLFMLSQMFAFWFCVFHPNRNKEGEPEISFCGSTCCCFSKKPLNCVTKACCCLNFLGKPASNPAEFIAAANWYLGGSIRIVLVPGVLFFLMHFPDLYMDNGIYGTKVMFSNVLIYILGYTVAATEHSTIGDICKKYRWSYFCIGFAVCLVDLLVILISFDLENKGVINQDVHKFRILIVLALLKAFGGWMFILGIFHIAKSAFTTPISWVTTLRELSMPFYLIHSNMLTIYMAGVLWVPFLRALPFTLLFGTFITGVISFLITKAGFLRYFFGLPCTKNSFLPGKFLRGFVPVISMTMFIILSFVLYVVSGIWTF